VSNIIKFAVLGFAISTLLVLFVGQLGWLKGKSPIPLGVQDHKLSPAYYGRENSVNSQTPQDPDKAYHAIEPISFSDSPNDVIVRLKERASTLNCRLVEEQGYYLRFECQSRLLKFIDDLEFLIFPEESLIHVRSASRLGQKDFGINRQRVESFRH